MTWRRCRWLLGAAVLAGLAALFAWMAITAPQSAAAATQVLSKAVNLTLFIGTPLAAGTVLLIRRLKAATRGRLGAERLLGLATAGLPPARQEWGTAMRAELLSIDDPSARRAFARSAAFAALRIGHARPLAIAGTTGLLAAAGTLAVSRLLLAVDKPIGIGIYTMFAPVLLLFAAALLGAATRRSFRSGLEAGVVALFVALVGVFAVMAVEAVTWAEHYGVYVFDGDRPSTGHLGPGGAVGDALSPFFIGLHLVLWVPWPVLGAALGAAVRHRHPADGAAARQGSSRS